VLLVLYFSFSLFDGHMILRDFLLAGMNDSSLALTLCRTRVCVCVRAPSFPSSLFWFSL
jgi:hypothetical protein